jgi:hypothetical protein
MTLREISGELMELKNMLEGNEEDSQVIEDTIDSVMYDFEQKTDGYGTVIKELESDVLMLAMEIKRLTDKKKLIENNISRMKTAIRENMENIGEKKITGELFTFSVRNNPPKLPDFIPTDKVPADCWRQKDPEIDRNKLKTLIKCGEVTGIDLIQTTSLMMK